MEFIEYDAVYEIKDMKLEIQSNEIIVKWHWPEAVNAVYVCRAKSEEGLKKAIEDPENMRLCTKAEYQNRGYYSEKITDRDEFIFKVYASVKVEGKWCLVNQNNKNNEKMICTGKLNIYQRVNERKISFSELKKVEITLWSEGMVSREYVCYVIKKGAYPHSKEDGLMFDFPRDVTSSQMAMPEIVIPKDWFMKVFLTSDIAARRYSLINA